MVHSGGLIGWPLPRFLPVVGLRAAPASPFGSAGLKREGPSRPSMPSDEAGALPGLLTPWAAACEVPALWAEDAQLAASLPLLGVG